MVHRTFITTTANSMQTIIEMLSYPFMQRAFIAGIFLGLLLASLGVLATLRKMAFFGEGIAHASLAGIALAIFAGMSPLPIAIAWAVLVAVIIYWLERSTQLSSDTLIGILFTASMALGVIIMSQTAGYQPELISFLFGSILTIRPSDLWVIGLCSVIILAWLIPSLKQLTYLSLNEDAARIAGMKTKTQTLLFYIALAVATVLGVKILGIVLVSALIVLPAATGRLLSSSFRSYMWMSLLVSELIIVIGLALSYVYDLPSGATIVLTGAGLFFLVTLARQVVKS